MAPGAAHFTRAELVRDEEARQDRASSSGARLEACPLLWWNRIVVSSAKFKGWNMSPSHYIGQDLADVWIEQ